jgi:hypothetical protein
LSLLLRIDLIVSERHLMAKARTPRTALSFTEALFTIADELASSQPSPLSPTAITISNAIKRARDAASGHPEDADPTELLTLFHPTPTELTRMGLPKDFLDHPNRCSNHTALYMADFTRFTRSARATKKKGKKSRRKK